MGVGATNLKRVATVLLSLLVAAACSQSTPLQPAQTPAVPGDLVFIPKPKGTAYHVVVIAARDGTQVADLTGYLVATLDQGGDVAEAYVVSGNGLVAVKPGRPFVTTQLDTTPLGGIGIFAPAPNLQTFVGSRSVFIVARTDSRVAGYQHGKLIWTALIDGGRFPWAPTLSQVGDQALVYTTDGRKLIVPETGELKDLPAACGELPVTTIGTGFLCYLEDGGQHVIDTASGRTTPVAGPVIAFRAVKSRDLFLQSGRDFYRLDAGGKLVWHTRVNFDPGLNGAMAPDASAFYLADPIRGINVVPTSGAPARSIPGAYYHQVAPSRDGTFVYAVSNSSLDVLHLPDGSLYASYPAGGSEIRLVAGG